MKIIMKIQILTMAIIIASMFVEIEGKQVRHIYYGQCKDEMDLPIVFENVKKRDYSKTNRTIESDLIVKKEIQSLGVTIDLWRCENEANPDTCQYSMRDKKMSNICKGLNKENQMWTNAMIDPPLKCPLKPDTYHLKFPADVSLWPLMGVWKLKFHVTDDGQNVACYEHIWKVTPK